MKNYVSFPSLLGIILMTTRTEVTANGGARRIIRNYATVEAQKQHN